MVELSKEKTAQLLASVPKYVKFILEAGVGVISGGYIRDSLVGNTPSDIDIYHNYSTDTLTRYLQEQADIQIGKVPITISVSPKGRVHTVKQEGVFPPIQFISVIEPLQHIREKFDYTVNAAAIWYAKGYVSSCPDDFLDSIANRRLVLINEKNLHAKTALKRLLKMYAKGFQADPETITQVMGVTFAGCMDILGRIEPTQVYVDALQKLWDIKIMSLQKNYHFATDPSGDRDEIQPPELFDQDERAIHYDQALGPAPGGNQILPNVIRPNTTFAQGRIENPIRWVLADGTTT
jgi:hypothetical protein